MNGRKWKTSSSSIFEIIKLKAIQICTRPLDPKEILRSAETLFVRNAYSGAEAGDDPRTSIDARAATREWLDWSQQDLPLRAEQRGEDQGEQGEAAEAWHLWALREAPGFRSETRPAASWVRRGPADPSAAACPFPYPPFVQVVLASIDLAAESRAVIYGFSQLLRETLGEMGVF